MDYILKKIEESTIHMGLIDPDEQEPEKAGELGAILEEVGSDAVMVGGSTGITKESLDDTIKSIKERCNLPVIIFPSRAKTISEYADAIYFMSMLNSTDITKVIGEQALGAPLIKKMNIEPLSMAYLIVEPGMTVGRVGDAELIPRDNPKRAIGYGLAAKFLGMDLLYLEAGSGAPEPIPTRLISAVKQGVGLPLIIGGGITNEGQARAIADAGADIIVTGTLIEQSSQPRNRLKRLIEAIKR